jgi:uncharacterized protein (TIGR02444 family)
MAPAERGLTTDAAGAGRFKRFALELYRQPGVAGACLALQGRHDLDVNVVLFAAFTGAGRRRTLTADDVGRAYNAVGAWHQEVVRPLRAVRQRLKTGPAPAPSEPTGRLRRKLPQLEIEAEMIELDQLGALVQEAGSPCPASGAQCAAAAIESVIRTHAGTALNAEDHAAIDTIADQAQQAMRAGSRRHLEEDR